MKQVDIAAFMLPVPVTLCGQLWAYVLRSTADADGYLDVLVEFIQTSSPIFTA
jgi:hypothetical protein